MTAVASSPFMLKTTTIIEPQELDDANAAILALGYSADQFNFKGWLGRNQNTRLGRTYVEVQRGDKTSALYETIGKFSWVTKFEDDMIAGAFGPK